MNTAAPALATATQPLLLEVAEVKTVAERIREIRLIPVAGALPPFEPGAHIEVLVPDGSTRPYSLIAFDVEEAAAPRLYRLGVLLEQESRGGSRFMHALAAGDTVQASLPKNTFPLAAGGDPALLLAGGIGVTPIVSMAAELKGRGSPYRFLYAARSESAMAFRAELEARHGSALMLHFDDQAGGPPELAPLIRTAAMEGAHLYICGPRAMIEAARRLAEAAAIPAARVHVELFDAPLAEAGDQPFEVEIASTGQVFVIPPGKSIIEVLEAAGIELVYDCQRGDCGICQTRVLAGIPDHRDVVLTEAERASNQVMQICVSRAKSPRLKLDL